MEFRVEFYTFIRPIVSLLGLVSVTKVEQNFRTKTRMKGPSLLLKWSKGW
jgi:hypothetical protein